MCVNDSWHHSNGENQTFLHTSPVVVYAPLLSIKPHFLLTKLNLHLKFDYFSFQLVNLSKEGEHIFQKQIIEYARLLVSPMEASYENVCVCVQICILDRVQRKFQRTMIL